MLTMVPGCDLDVERGPDCLLVRVRNWDSESPDAPRLAERLQRLMQQHFTARLLLELDEVPTLDNRLIGQLASVARWIDEQEGMMRLCGLSPHNRHVLRAYRLDEPLPSYKDREEAVMGRPHFAKPR
jgi:anti-anti-sigma regulatory factor